MKNMVDERFELASVIFRLAGREEYSVSNTDYQKEVAEKFAEFATHKAVEYAKGLPLGYDAVLKFAVHIEHIEIEKSDGKFIFIEDISSLFDGRWNNESAKKFLELFNDFYIDTNYAEFYNSHVPYFEEITQNFIDETYGKIELEWFRKYIDPANLRFILSPSANGGYGAMVNDKIFYGLSEYGVWELIVQEYYNNDNEIVEKINSGEWDYYLVLYYSGLVIVHEYCHSFANPLAEKLYNENLEFKKWCDDSLEGVKDKSYNSGLVIAGEYITRACTLLYFATHDGEFKIGEKTLKYSDFISLEKEKDENGFPYIEDVYKMLSSRA